MAYFDIGDLEDMLGKGTVASLFDDDQDGIADIGPVRTVANAASVEIDAVLAGTYEITLPIPSPPDVLKYAAVELGIAFAMRRRPDVANAMNAKSWTDYRTAAHDKIKMFATAYMRLPKTTATPKNVGSLTFDDGHRIISSDPDGTNNSGDF